MNSKIFNLVKVINDAKDGDTIILTSNVNLDSEINLDKELIINLNGFTITSKKDVFIGISNKCNVTIVGTGKIRGGSGGSYTAITVNAGIITLNGDINYSVGPDENNEGNSCIYVSGSGKVNINNGHFSTDAAYHNRYYVVNKKNGSNGIVNIKGGTFDNYDPTSGDDVDEGSFIPKGYDVDIIDNKVTVVKSDNVKIVAKKFLTLYKDKYLYNKNCMSFSNINDIKNYGQTNSNCYLGQMVTIKNNNGIKYYIMIFDNNDSLYQKRFIPICLTDLIKNNNI